MLRNRFTLGAENTTKIKQNTTTKERKSTDRRTPVEPRVTTMSGTRRRYDKNHTTVDGVRNYTSTKEMENETVNQIPGDTGADDGQVADDEMDISGSADTGDSWATGDSTTGATPGSTDMDANGWNDDDEFDDQSMNSRDLDGEVCHTPEDGDFETNPGETSVNQVTPARTLEQEEDQPHLLNKRKKDELKQHPNDTTNSPENSKTPKRGGSTTMDAEVSQSSQSTPTNDNRQRDDQSIHTDDTPRNSPVRNRGPGTATGRGGGGYPRIHNMYKPKTTTGIPITYSGVATGAQSTIVTHEKTKEKYETLYEVTFTIPRHAQRQYGLSDDTSRLQQTVVAILSRAREVDRKAKINTWYVSTNAPTLKKTQDIPITHALLVKYINPMYSDRQVRPGRNGGWRIRITTSVSSDEFLHYWNISKREYNDVDFVTLREAPLQTTSFHAAGYFLNSSEGQLTDQLAKALTEEMKCEIGISHRPAAMDKDSANRYWDEAKRAATDQYRNFDRQALFRHAPFAQQVYVTDRHRAVYAAGYLHEKYGKQTQDGQYPRMPDGTRMRFIPASAYLDMAARRRAGELFRQHIHFQSYSTYAPIPIRDPMQRFQTQNNRTMQELVLDLLCEEKDNEPYFRHLKKRYFRNFRTTEYTISIHNEMFHLASTVLRNLKGVLTERYHQEVGDALMEQDDATASDTFDAGTASFSGISLETDDRYMNGKGKFVILGLERISQNQASLADIRQEEDDRSLNPRSSATGMTGHTGQTIPEPDIPMEENTSKPADETNEDTSMSTRYTRVGSLEDEEELRGRVRHMANEIHRQDNHPQWEQDVARTRSPNGDEGTFTI